MSDNSLPRDLGDGLVLRRSVQADAEALAEFNSEVFREPGAATPNEESAAWTRDLLRGDHPSFGQDDFTIVEDARTGRIVSSLCLISQTWSYGGIPFGVGRPELVGTHPDYRRRGLVRVQMDEVHRWSAERGELAQAITGIPWYYRQFGYEMALAMWVGRLGFKANVPRLKEGEPERYIVRPAGDADLPFISEVYRQAMGRWLVAAVFDEALWRYELHGRSEPSPARQELRIVETAGGTPVGFLRHFARMEHVMGVTAYELEPGASWTEVTPSVLRYLEATGRAYGAGRGQEFERFGFWLSAEHPVYKAIESRLPQAPRGYAWYIRVPALPAFLRRISPMLERRLAGSILSGYTGELKLSFYRSGVRLGFEGGQLAAIEPWSPESTEDGSAGFPELTFLQLLFGFRDLEELQHAFPDCRLSYAGGDEVRALLNALFPRQASLVLPVG
jgi:hypothetical protein